MWEQEQSPLLLQQACSAVETELQPRQLVYVSFGEQPGEAFAQRVACCGAKPRDPCLPWVQHLLHAYLFASVVAPEEMGSPLFA
jgi:hypothetical protein